VWRVRIRWRRHRDPESAGTAAASAEPTDDRNAIAGYRVVRRLGTGELADVYLGVPSVPGQGVTRAPVALKIFRPEASGAAIEREFRVLTEGAGARFAALIDVATLSDGRVCFVQEHLPGIRLSRWLGEGSLLAPGEAVTILAPVAAALAELLDLGYLHDGPGQRTVRLDARGRPVLTGLGRLRDLPPPGPTRSRATEEAADRFAAFALGVLDRVGPAVVGPGGPAPAAWLASAAPRLPFRGLLDEFEHRLFNWAAAAAVQLESRAPQVEQGSKWDASESVRRILLPGGSPGTVSTSGPAGRLRLLSDVRLVAQARDRLVGALRGHRRPLLVAWLVAVAVVVLLLTFLYSPDSPGGGTETVDVRSPTSAATSAPTATPRAPPRADDAEGDGADLEGDEPVRAVQVLLRRRAGCLVAASVACLDGVDQAGSVALAADAEAIRTAQQSGSAAVPASDGAGGNPALLERSGDVALVGVVLGGGQPGKRKPASVLVVKGEAGWRIRQVFDY